MKRREFITLLGSAAAGWPLAASAQQSRIPVIGVLGFENPAFVAGFHQGLAEAGYVSGQNVSIEFRWADNLGSMPRLAAELVGRGVDVIVTTGSPYAAVAAKAATSTIPIVFVLAENPVQYGLVTILSRPGGNVTGLSLLTTDLSGKRLNLLLELAPQATAIAYLSVASGGALFEERKDDMLAAGRALGREIIVLEARGFDFEAAFKTLLDKQARALIVGDFTVFQAYRDQIVQLAVVHRIPTMYASRDYVVDGGLMSYEAKAVGAGSRQVARDYVGPILKGAKPADLPVHVQLTKFELVLNLRTAKMLDLTIPRMLFAAATELID